MNATTLDSIVHQNFPKEDIQLSNFGLPSKSLSKYFNFGMSFNSKKMIAEFGVNRVYRFIQIFLPYPTPWFTSLSSVKTFVPFFDGYGIQFSEVHLKSMKKISPCSAGTLGSSQIAKAGCWVWIGQVFRKACWAVSQALTALSCEVILCPSKPPILCIPARIGEANNPNESKHHRIGQTPSPVEKYRPNSRCQMHWTLDWMVTDSWLFRLLPGWGGYS